MQVDLILAVPVALLLFAGIAVLEAFLAKKGKKQGLVLPLIFLGLSVIVFAGRLAVPMIQSTLQVELRANQFAYAEDGTILPPDPGPSFLGIDSHDFVEALLWFLICNAFTAVLLAVYAVCRSKRRRQQGLERMRVQDL